MENEEHEEIEEYEELPAKVKGSQLRAKLNALEALEKQKEDLEEEIEDLEESTEDCDELIRFLSEGPFYLVPEKGAKLTLLIGENLLNEYKEYPDDEGEVVPWVEERINRKDSVQSLDATFQFADYCWTVETSEGIMRILASESGKIESIAVGFGEGKNSLDECTGLVGVSCYDSSTLSSWEPPKDLEKDPSFRIISSPGAL